VQGRLFPLPIARVDPVDLGSADCSLIGTGLDGIPYVLKTTKEDGGPYVPLSEWVCSHLADVCYIPVPPFAVAELPEKEFAFASRWEGGVLKLEDVPAILSGIAKIQGVDELLGSIYAFDLFVSNPDRHFRNYLLREAGPDRRAVLMAPDYSRALIANGWPLPPPRFDSFTNTERAIRKLAATHDRTGMAEGALALLDRLESLPGDFMDGVLKYVPHDWDPQGLCNHLAKWWETDRNDRISVIRRGIEDGTYPALRDHQGSP